MSSTFTPAKNLEQPSNDSYIGTWDQPVNSNWGIIDSCFGAITVINATGAPTAVYLTIEQTQCFAVNVTGTLTQNLTFAFPLGIPGEYLIINSTTGAFTVKAAVANSTGVNSTIVIQQGPSSLVYTDGLNIYAPQASVSTDGKTIIGTGTSGSVLAGGRAQAWWYQTSSLSGGGNIGFASISNTGYDGSVFTFTTAQPDTDYVVMITPLAPYSCGVSAQGTGSFTISQIGGSGARVAIAVTVFR